MSEFSVVGACLLVKLGPGHVLLKAHVLLAAHGCSNCQTPAYIYMLTPPCMTYLLAKKSRISSIICPSLHRYWWGTALGFHCTREQNTKLIIFNAY